MNENNKKILEKQLELLSERSQTDNLTVSELAQLTHAICEITCSIREFEINYHSL